MSESLYPSPSPSGKMAIGRTTIIGVYPDLIVIPSNKNCDIREFGVAVGIFLKRTATFLGINRIGNGIGSSREVHVINMIYTVNLYANLTSTFKKKSSIITSSRRQYDVIPSSENIVIRI